MADEHFEAEDPTGSDTFDFEMTFDFVTRLSRCVVFMLQKLGDANLTNKGEELLGIFQSTKSIVMLAQFVRMDDRNNTATRTNSYFFTKTEYDELLQIFLSRVKDLQDRGQLIGYTDEENLRRIWRVLLLNNRVKEQEHERKEYRRCLRNDVGRYPNVLHVLLPYRYYDDRILESYSPPWIESLAEDFDINTILETLRSASADGEWLRKMIKIFEYSIEIHEKLNKWPHPDEQSQVISKG